MKVISMEPTKKTEEMLTLQMEKFPFLGAQKKSVETLKSLIELLNKRVKLLKSAKGDVTPFEENENKITLVKTDIELAKLHSQVLQKENAIKDYTNNVTEYLKEMDSKWSEIMQKAEKKAKMDKDLAGLLEKSKTQDFGKNIEHKIGHYIQVKNYLYPNKTK